jgi:hypothetical protein
MSIRSLIVKIGADTQDIDKALAGVGASSKTLADGLKKLGDTPIGKEAQASAEQLKKNLDAVNASIQRTADLGVNAAKGIDAIGGPAKLTTGQLNVMNRAIQDSLDAFRALGQQAPQDLQKVAAAIQAQQKLLQTPIVPKTTNPLAGALGSLPGGNILSELSTGGAIAAVGGVAAAGAAALTGAAHAALEYADGLVKMSDKTGIGVEALQRLEAIAVPSGNSLDDLTRAVNQFQNRLISGQAEGALRQLGISFEQIRSAAPDEQFILIAQALQKVSDPAEQTRLAIELFGKAGAEVLPSLKANVDTLKDSMVTMSADSVKALDDFGDELTRIKGNAVRLLGEIAASAINTAKALKGVVDALPRAQTAQTTHQDLSERPQLANSRVGPALSNAALGRVPDILGSTTLQQLAQIPQAVDRASAALQRLHADLFAQEAAANAAGLALEDYQKAIDQINEKIRQAERPLVDLTEKQLDQVIALRALGLSTEEIALKMGIGANSIIAFDKAMEEQAQVFAKNEGLSSRVQQAIGKLDLGYLKAADSARVLQHATLALTDAQASQFDGKDFLQGANTVQQFNKHLLELGNITDRNSGIIDRNNRELDEERAKADRAAAGIDDLARAFTQMAQISGGAFSHIVRDIGTLISGIDLAQKSLKRMTDQFDEAGNLIHSATGLDKLVGAAGLVGVGLQLGSSLINGITQALEHLELSRIGHDVGRDLGVAISEGTEQGIRQSEKQLADAFVQAATAAGIPEKVARIIADPKKFREAAIALNLPQIISDAGGIQAFGTDKAINKLHDLFSLVEQGKLTVAQIGDEFDQVFSQLVPTAISKTSKLVSASFVELQQTALRFGTSSPALEQFRSQQIGNVNTGLSSTLGVNADATARAIELQKQLNDARGKGDSDEAKAVAQIIDLQAKLDKESNGDKRAAIQAQINDLLRRGATDYSNVVALQKELDKQQNLIAATNIKSQASATGFAGALLASFGELQRQGVPLLDIFKQIGPNITALQQQLDRTGFSGGAAFDKLKDLAALASDELAGPALDAVSGVQQALAGLANTGGLDADTFSGLAASVGDTFRSLVDQGKDGNQVLKLMAPTLQTIFELQERTGFAVDETTANLIAQAKAQGIVGEQFKSADERQVDGLNKIADILAAIAKQLGVTLPDAAKDGADKVKAELGSIKAPNLTIGVGFNVDTNELGVDLGSLHLQENLAATGGLVTANGIQHFASGGRVLPFLRHGTDTVPAMLTPGEIVLNASQQKTLADGLGGVTVNGLQVTVVASEGDDPKTIADKVLEALRTQAHLYQGFATIADRQITAAA